MIDKRLKEILIKVRKFEIVEDEQVAQIIQAFKDEYDLHAKNPFEGSGVVEQVKTMTRQEFYARFKKELSKFKWFKVDIETGEAIDTAARKAAGL